MNWIRKTFSDEKGNPSSLRQMAFVALVATLFAAFFKFDEYLVSILSNVTLGLSLGAVGSKFSSLMSRGKKEDYGEGEQPS